MPIILAIVLATIVLAVVLTIVIYKSYRKTRKDSISKHNTTLVETPVPQINTTINKQEMALLYEERIMAMQQHQMQQQALINNGLYMQPRLQQNSYTNTKVMIG